MTTLSETRIVDLHIPRMPPPPSCFRGSHVVILNHYKRCLHWKRVHSPKWRHLNIIIKLSLLKSLLSWLEIEIPENWKGPPWISSFGQFTSLFTAIPPFWSVFAARVFTDNWSIMQPKSDTKWQPSVSLMFIPHFYVFWDLLAGSLRKPRRQR